jgi:2-succinyl-5-enolpyruvyl-6-hydroxy-3-cyclohexene-1-carboxylate synthase
VLIVAGAGTPEPQALAAFAARSRLPLLADPLSGARRGAAAIAHYDLLLRDPGFADAHRPDFVLRLGALPTSKPLRSWLASLADTAQIACDPHGTWQDPDAVVGTRLRGRLPEPDGLAVPAGWLNSWRADDEAAAAAAAGALGEALSEPLVTRELGSWLPSEVTLFVASSMPIRDAESFIPARDDGPRVLSNRGANGIDGTVSAAFGAAAAGGGRVVLLIGDVALAHDIGGLLCNRRLDLAITIVLLNNDGGGIFHFLPVAGQRDAFEEQVATPHGLDFAHAAALYGCRYERPSDRDGLRAAVEKATGTTIIEVRTDRNENLTLHQEIVEAVRVSRQAPEAAPQT